MAFDTNHAKNLCSVLSEYAHPRPGSREEVPDPFEAPLVLDAPLGSVTRMLEQAVQRIEELETALVKERVRYNLLFPEMWSKDDRRDSIAQAREQLQKEGLL